MVGSLALTDRRHTAGAMAPAVFFALLIALMAALLGGCGEERSAEPVASVHGVPIEASDVDFWMSSFERGGEVPAAARRGAMTFLINAAWVRREARLQDVRVTRRELAAEEGRQRRKYGGAQGLATLRRRVGLTGSKFRTRLRLDLLARRLQPLLIHERPISSANVASYYQKNSQQLEAPAARDLRAIVSRDRREALEARRQLRSGAGGKPMTIDTTNVIDPLRHAVFSAPEGVPMGPVRIRGSWWVFQVTATRPAHRLSFAESKDQIRTLLEGKREAQEFKEFVALLGRRNREETECLGRFRVPECGAVVESSEQL